MKEKLQVGVIGLGKFGLKFGKTLVDLGHEVLGIDNNYERISQAQNILTQVLQADATNKEALKQIGVSDLTYVLISVGESIAASTMITMFLKELNVPKVWAKATNSDHEKLLRKIGIDEVVIPEHMAAKQIANRIAMPGFIEHLPFDKSMGIKEFKVSRWSGKTLREVDLTNRYDIQVIAVKGSRDEEYRFIPKADDQMKEGDRIVAIGKITQLARIKP